jgi:S1-C subfamily serine protease
LIKETKMKTIRGKIAIALAVILIGGIGFAFGTGVHLVANTASAAPTLYSQDTMTSLYDAASPAVVEINVTQTVNSIYGKSTQSGLGSGFLIDTKGDIVTNNHVVEGATTVEVVLKNGNSVTGKVLGTDPVDDVAVVSIDASAVSGITPLKLGDSSLVKAGQMAVAIGNPLGYTDSITVGVISGLNRSVAGSNLRGMLQTDAAINPGNSGGPLLDNQGNVIGMNTAAEIGATGADGIGFAIPSNTINKLLTDLIAGKTVSRPWLGISGTALTQATASQLGLSVNKGVYVVTVVANGPAEKAGLKAGGSSNDGTLTAGGDVITAVDGKSIASIEDLSAYISTKQVGDTVSLTVLRSGQNTTVQVTLAAWPANTTSDTTPQVPQAPTQTPQTPIWPHNPRVPRSGNSN